MLQVAIEAEDYEKAAAIRDDRGEREGMHNQTNLLKTVHKNYLILVG
ncbi:MAG: UvrB/UvrC motif-containing protein [Bacteroidales bacterium]